jgi:hypothetical protein
MKKFSLSLVFFMLFITPIWSFSLNPVDWFSDDGSDAETIAVLYKIFDVLDAASVINQNQSDDIYEIFKHYERIDRGDAFVDVLADEGFDDLDYETKQEIWHVEQVKDDVVDLGKLIDEANKKEEDKTKQKVTAIKKQRKKTTSLNQDGVLRQGVNYQGLNLQEQVFQTEYAKKTVAIAERKELQEMHTQVKHDLAFPKTKKSTKDIIEAEKRYYQAIK